MNLKTIAVTALTLISYLNTINAMPEAVDVADSVSPGSPTAPIDTVGEPGYMDLEEFVIVQQKKLVESDGAKLTYNVTEDPESGSSNILEILRKVPGVTVDAEDNVKVNGQSSFKILMNNREDPMLKGDIWPRWSTNDSESEDLTGGPNHLLRAHNRTKSGWDYVGVSFNMSWEPDSLNLFTLSGYYY